MAGIGRRYLRRSRVFAFDPRQTTLGPLETQAARLRSARSQDLHVSFCADLCPVDPQRRSDLEVLDIVGGSSGNHVVETSIKEVGADVEKGDNLSVSLSRKSIFPPMLLRMVAAGEATGKIDTMLEKMADFWDEEIEAMLDALTSLIEPMLIVFLGVIVGGIVIAMFLPIFKLNEVVSQNKSN